MELNKLLKLKELIQHMHTPCFRFISRSEKGEQTILAEPEILETRRQYRLDRWCPPEYVEWLIKHEKNKTVEDLVNQAIEQGFIKTDVKIIEEYGEKRIETVAVAQVMKLKERDPINYDLDI